jgi:hypothetical protein
VIENLGASPITVEKLLVGPHPELGDVMADDWDIARTEASANLQPLLMTLREAGAPAPTVGQDIGEPAIASNVELVWDDEKLAVTLDHEPEEVAALSEAGWTVIEWDDAQDTGKAIADTLGVTLTPKTEEVV